MVGLIFAPFSAPLWILIVIAYLITTLVYWLITRMAKDSDSCILDAFWKLILVFGFFSTPCVKVVYCFSHTQQFFCKFEVIAANDACQDNSSLCASASMYSPSQKSMYLEMIF